MSRSWRWRWLKTASTWLAQELAVGDADELELYQALDWLLGRQQAIEDKLARRHLKLQYLMRNDGIVGL